MWWHYHIPRGYIGLFLLRGYQNIYIYSSNIPSIIYLYYFFLTIKDDLDITKLNNNKFEGTGYLIKSMKFQTAMLELGTFGGCLVCVFK